MVNPLDWIQLAPKDDTPSALRQWCIKHSILVSVFVFIVVLFVLPAMLWAVPKLGSLAWSDDIDKKIEAAVEPIRRDIENIKKKDIQEIKDEVKRSNDTAKDIKASLLASSILNARRQQCDAIATGTSARFWSDRLIDLKADYRKLTGEQFDMPVTCAEL